MVPVRTLALILFMLFATSAFSATFTVNSTGDETDASPGDGICQTSTPGECTLRAAVAETNSLGGADTIVFDIAAGGLQTIIPGSTYQISGEVTIDGTTQPGYDPAAPTPMIEVDGTAGGGTFPAFFLFGSNRSLSVKGFIIHGFSEGIRVFNANSSAITVQGSYIGTNASGTAASPNTTGIDITSAVGPIQIGGTTAAERNVISGNTNLGIRIPTVTTPAGSSFVIEGNYIGLGADGSTAIPNGTGVSTAVRDMRVRNNVISCNTLFGLALNAAAGLSVEGNIIGVQADGTSPCGNGSDGIFAAGGSGYTIRGNVISGNSGNGIAVGSGTSQVENAVIGGTAAGEGNIISSNGMAGIFVTNANSTGHTIEGNSIAGNGGLGIDLATDDTTNAGVTANDALDADTGGANRLQNFPVITSAITSGTAITIGGTLQSEATRAYRICTYGNTALDATSHGEGESFLGCTDVNTDASGNATFSMTSTMPAGAMFVTATATDTARGDTSEFSAGLAATAVGQIQFNSAAFNMTEGGGNVPVTVSRTGGSGGTVSVTVSTSNGTAIAGSDYTGTSTLVTFTNGDSADKTVLIPIAEDAVYEGNETFTVTLSNPTGGATIGTPNQAVVTILDNDPLPSLSIDSVSVTEGDSGSVNTVFTVTKSGATALTTTVSFATANGTATAPADYTATSGTLTFAPGETTQTITVAVNGDLVTEGNETFQVNLSSPSNATIAAGQGVGTILDDDAQPSVSIADVAFVEANSGTTIRSVAVTLSGPSSQTVTVDYATSDGTATADSDYTAAAGTLTFAPGQTVQNILVGIIADTVDEGTAEAFTITIGPATNATLGTATATVTITDDDDAPQISVSDPSVVEGNSGSVSLVFTVTLSNASNQSVTVDFATAGGTATAGSDYTTTTGTLIFNPGDVTRTVAVPVLGDTIVEAAETVLLNLSAPGNATIADSQGVGTILDDDGTPALSIDDVTVPEGNSGTTNAQFTVTLAPASSSTVTIQFATAGGTATAGSDFASQSGTLTFNPGETTNTITVAVTGDTVAEANETFSVNLSSATNATIADAQGVGTIVDDDGTPALSIGDITVTEGNSGTTIHSVPVTLSGASSETVTVDYATSDGTATAGSDYTAASGTLTFAPGQTVQNILVGIAGDTIHEDAAETFTITLGPATNATILDGEGVVTILDDDGTPSLSISDVTITEGNSGTTNAVFTVFLVPATSSTVTVNYATADGTAVAGADYAAQSGSLTFNPGETSRAITVAIITDTIPEPGETFTIVLSGATSATIADAEGLGTIIDDDGSAAITINDVAVTEGNFGSTSAQFTVSLSSTSSETVTVSFTTSNQTAVAGSDYVATSGTLTFPPGSTAQAINVAVIGDLTVENNETFVVTLSGAQNATIVKSTGAGTIINDDFEPPPPPPPPAAPPTVSIDPSARVTECTGGTAEAVLTVRVSSSASSGISVEFRTTDGTARAGSDYQARNAVLHIPPGALSATISIPILCDGVHEPEEIFFVTLGNTLDAQMANSLAVVTIADDDEPEVNRHAIVTVVGDAPGAHGSHFRTELRLFNPTTLAASGVLTFRPAGAAGGDADPSLSYSLQPRESRTIDLMRDLGGSGLGSVDVLATAGEPPVVFIRVFNDAGEEGTTGFAQNELTPVDALQAGERGVLFAPGDLTRFRYNVGVRTLDEPASIEIEVLDPAGVVRRRHAHALPARYFVQMPAADFIGAPLADGDTIVITVRSGFLIAYGATTDNRTNDPSVQFVRRLR